MTEMTSDPEPVCKQVPEAMNHQSLFLQADAVNILVRFLGRYAPMAASIELDFRE